MNIVTIGRRASGKITNPYLMTKDTNPEVLAVCYGRGWCASPDYMTYEEAANVSGNIDNVFTSKGILHFDEFEHFTAITRCPSFAGNTKMTSIKLPPNITYIVGYAFRRLSLLGNLTLPATVTEIRPYAFADGPRIVTLLPTTPPLLVNRNAFNYPSNDNVIRVPAESVQTYKSASVWSDLANRIKAIPTYNKINTI